MNTLSSGDIGVIKEAYGSVVEPPPQAPEWDDIQQALVGSSVAPGRSFRWHPVVVAGASAAVVLMLVGGVAWLLQDGRSTLPATRPAPTAPIQVVTTPPVQPTPTTPVPVVIAPPATPESPSTTLSLLGTEPPRDPTDLLATVPVDFLEGWTQPSLLESGLAGAQLERIFAWGDRLVGIGSDPETGLGTVWTSADGLHWARSGNVYIDSDGEATPSAPFPPFRWMNVKVGGPGLVAVDKPGSVGAEVWVAELSEAGVTWKDTASIPGPCCFVDIAASEDVIVVVSEKVDHQDGNPGVWTSNDAYTWERVPNESLPFGTAASGLGFVEAGGPGFVGTGFGNHSIYVSVDGTEWFSPPGLAAAYPDSVHESLITLGHSSYGRLCLGEANGRWMCGIGTSESATSLAALDGRYVSIRAKQFDPRTGRVDTSENQLGLSADGRHWSWLPATHGMVVPAAPIDVVEWRGQIIVLTDDDAGGAIWAWTPQPAQ